MKKTTFIILLTMIYNLTVQSQAVYVDSNTGDDKNPGNKEAPVFSVKKAAEIISSGDNSVYTMKINPGIYVLDSHISVSTAKMLNDKRIVIEASILPDDTSWTPEKMPIIASKSIKGEIPELPNWVVCFLVNESHVTIRGIKFHGYYYAHTRYFPIARYNKTKTDLLVEQCMFVGDANISQIQAGVIAFENEIKVDHCIFYKVRNAMVFLGDEGSFTNSIFFGTSQVIWTGSPKKSFIFENNVVSNCRYVWVNNDSNTENCSMDKCLIVNYKYFKGIPDKVRLNPGQFEINEKNVTKKGEISLRLTGNDDNPFLDEVDKPLPIDYMHVIPNSPGYELGAGIFRNKK